MLLLQILAVSGLTCIYISHIITLHFQNLQTPLTAILKFKSLIITCSSICSSKECIFLSYKIKNLNEYYI